MDVESDGSSVPMIHLIDNDFIDSKLVETKKSLAMLNVEEDEMKTISGDRAFGIKRGEIFFLAKKDEVLRSLRERRVDLLKKKKEYEGQLDKMAQDVGEDQ